MNNNEKQSSLPSTQIAKYLISNLNSSKIPSISKQSTFNLLQILKHKKHPNHEKFANHIQRQLSQQKIQLLNLIDMITMLSKKCQQVENSDAQIKSLCLGIKSYIQKCMKKQNMSAKERNKLIQIIIANIFQFSQYFSIALSDILSKYVDKVASQQQKIYEKQIHSMIIDSIKNKNVTTARCRQCCALIHYMDLYSYFKVQDLVYIVRGTKSQNVTYFFKDRNGNVMKQLVEGYVTKEKGNDEKHVLKLVKSLSLDVNKFSDLTKQLTKKGLRYFLKQLEIYSLDLVLAERSDIAQCLVEILLDDRRQVQALHFINKHYLSKFYHLNPTQKRSFNKNILLDKDKFMPTQHILANYYKKYSNSNNKFLTLSQFGFQQKDVHFINSKNLTQKLLQNIINSSRIGIDCENKLAFNSYDTNNTQVWQIAINQKTINIQEEKTQALRCVYVLDFNQMKNDQVFKAWFERFCCQYKGKIVGHTVRKDFFELISEAGLRKISSEAEKKLRFVDIADKFKQKLQQTKSSLQYICSKLLGRSLSKFQQKSGWNNRPLRRAQLHYAALDSVLPLIINDKL